MKFVEIFFLIYYLKFNFQSVISYFNLNCHGNKENEKNQRLQFDGVILDSLILAKFLGIIPHHFNLPIFTVPDIASDLTI